MDSLSCTIDVDTIINLQQSYSLALHLYDASHEINLEKLNV
ncbi:hypothetical protein [Psychromonas sp. Urea-02u-13]|nr:hypothetical protein [Psychromonas sp. Urea-02u-13]